MSIENRNRYRVSSKYIVTKIAFYFVLLILAFNLIRGIRNNTLTRSSLGMLILVAIVIIVFLRILSTRKIIEYDDIAHILYVFDSRGQLEAEIHVKEIDQILYSSVGIGRGDYSYLIIYRDRLSQEEKRVRLYPIPFQKDINTIIVDAKLENPDLITRKWSFGWNELFD